MSDPVQQPGQRSIVLRILLLAVRALIALPYAMIAWLVLTTSISLLDWDPIWLMLLPMSILYLGWAICGIVIAFRCDYMRSLRYVAFPVSLVVAFSFFGRSGHYFDLYWDQQPLRWQEDWQLLQIVVYLIQFFLFAAILKLGANIAFPSTKLNRRKSREDAPTEA